MLREVMKSRLTMNRPTNTLKPLLTWWVEFHEQHVIIIILYSVLHRNMEMATAAWGCFITKAKE